MDMQNDSAPKNAQNGDQKTAPNAASNLGTEHPISIIRDEALAALSDLGFEVRFGPELEDEWHNFDALNVAKDHPARDMQDTFWIKGEEGKVLRTHATSVTSRALEEAAKEGRIPFAGATVGKTYRNEATDITHEMQFHQIDACMIGENVTLANMKAVLIEFYKKVLGNDVEIEFRPSFFPFTEPSVEVHAKFKGKWLEMMGGGMLHPNVLKNAGLDPATVQGFAFGGGIDRIAMIRWNISDIRLLYKGDLRINQF